MKNFKKFFYKSNNNTIDTIEDSSSRTRPDIEEQYRIICEKEKITSSIKTTEGMLEMAYASLNSIPESVFWVDKDAKFINVNNSAQVKLGYTEEELLKMHIFDIDSQTTVKKWHEIWESLKEGSVKLFETVHRKKDGTEFPVEITINFLTFFRAAVHVCFC